MDKKIKQKCNTSPEPTEGPYEPEVTVVCKIIQKNFFTVDLWDCIDKKRVTCIFASQFEADEFRIAVEMSQKAIVYNQIRYLRHYDFYKILLETMVKKRYKLKNEPEFYKIKNNKSNKKIAENSTISVHITPFGLNCVSD